MSIANLRKEKGATFSGKRNQAAPSAGFDACVRKYNIR